MRSSHRRRGSTATSSAESEPRSLLGMQREIRQALRDEATAPTLVERSSAVYELCALHREIVRDARFRTHEPLQEMRRQVASRLVKVEADLKRQLYRQRLEKPVAELREDVAWSLAEHLALVGAVQGGPARLLSDQGLAG